MRFLVFILVLGLLLSYSLAREVPFTLEDRDRIIRLEENQREGFRALMQRIGYTNKRIDDINKRIDDMISIMP